MCCLMKNFYTLLFCLASALLNAQITISATDMPGVNDTLRYSTGATTGLNATTIASNTGINYTWDFSALTPTDQLLQSFKASTATPYFLYFAGMIGYKRADSVVLGPLTQKNVWDFYKNTASKFTIEGTGFTTSGIPLASDYSDPDELYYFPLNYSDIDSGTFNVATSIPTLGSYIQAGKRKNSVDGWGNITTPFGTFNALRIKSVITETDTIKITTPINFSLPFSNNRIEYKWLAKGIHIPILEIVVGAGGIISSVKYRDQYHYIPKPPVANFTADQLFPKINNTVTFTDQSINNPTRWKWTITPATYTFAAGTVDTLQNIQLKFTANGNYTVSLRAQNNIGLNTVTKTAYIKVGDVPLIKFGADKLNVNISDLVTLTDSSSNIPTRWKWTILPSSYTFNTGSVDTLKSIGVKFSKGGFYTVDLKVTNAWGTDQATKSNYIWVNYPAGIQHTSSSELKLFPNPVQNQLQFTTNEANNLTVSIYNSCGALVYQDQGSLNNTINTEILSPGIYLLELKNNSEISRTKFVKN